MSLSLLDDCQPCLQEVSQPLYSACRCLMVYLFVQHATASYIWYVSPNPELFTRLYIEHSMLFLFSPYQLTTMCIRTSGNQTLPERSEPRPKTCQVHVPHQGIEPSLSNAAKTALDWGYQTCTWCVRHALNQNTSSSVWLQLENLVGQDVEFRFAKVAEGRSWDVGECTK